MEQDCLIKLKNVVKKFGSKTILNNIQFSIKPGEVIGLLGVNGAGKTTTINLMLGSETPNSGEILLFGKNPRNQTAREFVGSTPQNVEFPEGIKVIEILRFVHSHYSKSFPIKNMIDQFELNSFLDQKASKLSGGQKRRLALALAFIGNPKIVFLDEPTTGLDVQSRMVLWNVIKEYQKKGLAVFLTTHYLNEIDLCASRIIFLQDGTVKADCSANDFKNLFNTNQTQVTFICHKKFEYKNFKNIGTFDCQYTNYTITTQDSDALIYELVQNNVAFSNLHISKNSLEAAYLNLSQGERKL